MKHSPVLNRLIGNVLLVCRVAVATLIFLGNAVSAHLSVSLVITAQSIGTWCRIATQLVTTVFAVIVLQRVCIAATQQHAPSVFLRFFSSPKARHAFLPAPCFISHLHCPFVYHAQPTVFVVLVDLLINVPNVQKANFLRVDLVFLCARQICIWMNLVRHVCNVRLAVPMSFQR